MESIKCILLDIDKTLTDDNKTISSETSKFFSEINNKYLIILVSGRNAQYTIDKSIKCCASPIIISDNGAVIYNYKTDEVLYSRPFSKDIIDILWNTSVKHNMYSAFNALHKRYWNLTLMYDKKKENDTDIGVSECSEIVEPITQVVLHSDNETEFKKCLDEIKSIDEIEIGNYGVATNGESFADLIVKGTSKGLAIRELFDLFNIEKNNIICFGDSANDISMFESSGIKVAMKNGSEEVKKIADYITEFSNNENGVIEFLKKYL